MKKGEENKVLSSYVCNSLRELVYFVNERNIQKEDLWYLDKDKGQYVLLYFKTL